jgi:DNA-binding response OmpR family regulator
MLSKVLIIEDDPDIARLIQFNLPKNEYEINWVSEGLKGLQKIDEGNYDILLLDLNLPDMDGLEICKRVRQGSSDVLIMMITARSEEIDKVLGLEYGADDYLTKPFGIREMQARVKALLRRKNRDHSAPVNENGWSRSFGQLHIDTAQMKVMKSGERLELTPKEFQLLTTLAAEPGKTWSRIKLLQKIWGIEFSGYEHTVNSHINRLRAKVEDDMNKPQYILTSWGVGYRFNDEI